MNSGPYCTCAVFCDQVIEAKDNTLSAIRIIDTVGVAAVADDQKPQPPGPGTRPGVFGGVDFTYLIAIKSGDFQGRGKVRIDILAPNGKKLGDKEFEAEMLGGERGHNYILRGTFPPENGLFWFEVYFNDRLLTRTPLSVRVESSGSPKTTNDQPADQTRKQ